jgi:hypothetical protein
MSPTQLLNQLLVIFTGALCLFIAVQLGKRKLDNEGDRLAWLAFRIWWIGLGLTTAFGAVRVLMVVANIDSLDAYVWQGLLNTLVLCVALWGLLFYLLYLYTGNRRWALPLGIFYVLFYTGLVIYSFFVLKPQGVVLEGGVATVQYAVEPALAYSFVLITLVIAPQILATLAYFSLYFRLQDRAQKYRVLLVSISILVWFGSPVLAFGLGVSQLPWWMWVSRLLTLAAVVVIYWAYYPPTFIQRRFGVESI